MLLMHKNTPIAKIQIINGNIIGYEEIYKKDELPLGTIGNGKQQEQILLNHWYKSRAIPYTRPNIHNIAEKLGIERTEMFLQNSGVSITDTYWIKDENTNILWEDINYHDNGFDPVFASYYFNMDLKDSKMVSPDFTTDGIMEKFWFMSGNKPFLAKMDNVYDNTLSANEVVYYKTAASLGIETTPYIAGNTRTKQYVASPCFINNSNEDYISAMQLKHSDFSLTGENLIKYICQKLGYERQMREMITLDCFFHQKDRHEKNMGFKTSKNGLKFIPAFDNGFALGADRQLGSEITDNDMKLLSGKRAEILDRYGLPLNIDKPFVNTILQETYEQFNIPEERYEIAKAELNEGFNLIANIHNNKTILKDTIDLSNLNASVEIDENYSLTLD